MLNIKWKAFEGQIEELQSKEEHIVKKEDVEKRGSLDFIEEMK